MTKRILILAIFILIIFGYGISAYFLNRERQGSINDQFVQYTIPSKILKPISLEFKGLISDLLLLKFMTFIGARTEQLDQFTDEDWEAIKYTLETITDLDPYYWDAYLYSQVFLTWDKRHYEEANELLKKAQKYIPDNYRIPYYIGLNYYNFGKDSKQGAEYLMEASKLPGSPYYLANLAARLSAYESNYDRGIVFLTEMLRQTENPDIAEQYKLRISLLKRMQYLEEKIKLFHATYNRFPTRPRDLVDAGIIPEVPKEPYGGRFIIRKDGTLDTTSNMIKKNKKKKQKKNGEK